MKKKVCLISVVIFVCVAALWFGGGIPTKIEKIFGTNYIKEDLPSDAFDFSYKILEGSFERGEQVRVVIDMTNQQRKSYKWRGASTDYRPSVELVRINEGKEYHIYPDGMLETDDCGNYEVKRGETRSFSFRFNLPVNAISGEYKLVCSFENSTQTFGKVFEIK